MPVGTPIPVEEYLRTSFDPDCDYIDGKVLERNVGKRRHGYAQSHIGAWFVQPKDQPKLVPFIGLRTQVAPSRIRIPDIVVCQAPIPEEEVFTTPPYFCIEVMSPDDTHAALQDRLDDYLGFGIPNIWVVDPWKHRGWTIDAQSWANSPDGIMRTADGIVAMPLADVLLP